MKKPLLAIVVGGATLAGAAFWLGRSPDTADAKVVDVELARAETPAAVPSRVAPAPARPALPRPQPGHGLAADLVAADPKIRRAAVAEVARGDRPDPQTLLVASRDPDLDVARAAIAGVGKLYADGQVSTKDMVALAGDRAIPDRARIAVLNGLGTITSPEAAALLVQLLARGTTLERRVAAALLGNQDVELAVPALITALGDEDEYVRSNSLESLRLRARGRDFGTDAGAWQAWWQSRR